MAESQTCKDCGTNESLDFYVPDEIWWAVVRGGEWPGEITNPALCLPCFDRRAETRRVVYGSQIIVQGRRAWMVGRHPGSLPRPSDSANSQARGSTAGLALVQDKETNA